MVTGFSNGIKEEADHIENDHNMCKIRKDF